MLQFVNKSRQS